jgi:hypothetical protein
LIKLTPFLIIIHTSNQLDNLLPTNIIMLWLHWILYWFISYDNINNSKTVCPLIDCYLKQQVGYKNIRAKLFPSDAHFRRHILLIRRAQLLKLIFWVLWDSNKRQILFKILLLMSKLRFKPTLIKLEETRGVIYEHSSSIFVDCVIWSK